VPFGETLVLGLPKWVLVRNQIFFYCNQLDFRPSAAGHFVNGSRKKSRTHSANRMSKTARIALIFSKIQTPFRQLFWRAGGVEGSQET